MQENKLKTSYSYMIDEVQTNLSEFYGSLIALTLLYSIVHLCTHNPLGDLEYPARVSCSYNILLAY